jgi:hypothetical protein
MRTAKTRWMATALGVWLLSAVGMAPGAQAQPCEYWHSTNLHAQINGIDGNVFAATVWTPPGSSAPWLVIGGNFTTAGGVTVNNIAAWDGASWRALPNSGTGMNDFVSSLTVYNGELIAGGSFTAISGNPAFNRIARHDGTHWRSLGNGLELLPNGEPYCSGLTVFNGELIAIGDFWSAGGISARNIARWNGSSWSPLAGGLSMFAPQDQASGYCVAVHDSALYAGGFFQVAGATAATNIARWDGASWSALGSGTNGPVWCMTSFGTELAVGGQFEQAGGQTTGGIARWDGGAWSPYGGTQFFNCFVLLPYAGQLMAGTGGFSQNNLYSWNGANWTPLGGGLNESAFALAIYNGQLIAGGAFDTAGSTQVNRIARWNGTAWSALWVPPPVVTAFANLGSKLIVAGAFTQSTTNGVPANNIMAWDGARKEPLQIGVNSISVGPDGEVASVRALTSYTDGFGQFTTRRLVVGGYFTSAGGVPANRIAMWNDPNLTAPSWSTMGDGFNAGVFAVERFNNQTYAGGEFTMSGGTSVNRIARWTGSSWAPLGSGMNGNVYALKSFNGQLYAGGDFGTAGGVTTGGLARWNGSSWSNVGGTFVGTVLALEYYVSGGTLAIGGLFPGFTGAPNVALFNGGSYSPLDTGGTDNIVLSLHSFGDDLYIGGVFNTAGGLSAAHLARWSPWESWRTVRGGADAAVLALGSHQIEVQAGGVFDNVENGTIPARAWGRYVENETPWIVQHPISHSADCHDYTYFEVIIPWGYSMSAFWKKDGEFITQGVQPHGSDIYGANSRTLNIENVHAFDAGDYSCLVFNDCGEVETFAATLTVTNCCIEDIAITGGSGDGQVNIDDLLTVINGWGNCPEPPATCLADISPFGGDGNVNIDDLLQIINAWGRCN